MDGFENCPRYIEEREYLNRKWCIIGFLFGLPIGVGVLAVLLWVYGVI